MELFLFIVIGGITLISSFFVVFQRSPLYSALFLILTLLSMAGLYLVLGAEFIALIQVIVYAGAVMVLFLFVIMLLNLDKEKRDWLTGHTIQKILGFVIVVVLVPLIGLGISTSLLFSNSQLGAQGTYSPQIAEKVSNTAAVASLLFTDYILPFEITSVLLLVAMVGVVYLARRIKKPNPSGEKS
ncbi:MAG: NADH-quinone oxidoreductase subunit J [Deltaproteobacteria bacterium]|nr:NADH-quinone oxidoreductase subunit J [Deltaproteobacteria bacterium]